MMSNESAQETQQVTCHKWDGKYWLVALQGHYYVAAVGEHCNGCGAKMETVDGQPRVTPMVPAVTSAAVQETEFWHHLNAAVKEEQPSWTFVGCTGPDMPIIHAALSQSHGLAAAEWLAEKLQGETDTTPNRVTLEIPGQPTWYYDAQTDTTQEGE